jgi:signal transduction histidine kinase
LTYEKFLEIVHPEDRDYVDEKWHAAIKGELYDIEHRLLIDNELKWVREKAELMFDDKGNPICGVGITQDITDRKLAEISVQKSREALSALSAQLLSAEEKERKRIARDIHDGVGQALSAIKFSVENSLSSLTEESNQAARNALNNIVPLTQQTIEEVRRIVMDLRPSILDDLGLKATISWFCREFEVIYTDISIEQAINFEESNIDVPLKTVVYRILQEAFNNAAKHSRTEYILLRIEKTTDNLELLIEDKGIGFDVNEVELREINQRGVGLASMRERALLSGGTFDIKSSLKEGTRVYASWPTT